ncbi:MAG: hypothetical protein COT74_00320 [Bdellovibrionales bacterium CG10_big_fil_rev_8_21_14_0_10_45_34]|nr:MAG: hypothetical protein COT74_00320 [Bdellovibrionales bacterium CG10_big_fil_rev_8_21_14_0_10_45_34]
MDISWVSAEAKQIHTFFVSIFYLVATVLILLGVVIEYFKIPLGNMPAFSQLIGRALIATILLVAYPEISNTICALADAIAERLGDVNNYSNVLSTAGEALKQHSWSWTSIGDSLLSVVSYLAYFILYITVYFFDAAIIYCLVLLYIFSPIMIVFFILPQTAGLTSGLFRALCEIATWKIVWCVLGTLLWSTALNSFKHSGESNFITLLALTLMLTFSIILTPIVAKQLISGALSSVASQTAGLAANAMTAGALSTGFIAGASRKFSKKAFVGTARMAAKAAKDTAKTVRKTRNRFSQKMTNNNIPEDPMNDCPQA